ncbi:PKD domain-containing protein [Bacteroidota bacterium]
MSTLRKTLFLFSIIIAGFTLSLNAQVRNFTFQSTSATFTPITGGTQHGSATVDDASYDTLALGFTFDYCGQSFTKVSINSNGYIAFGYPIEESYNPISDPYTNNYVVSALSHDIKGQSNGELRSELLGSSPNRVFVVQWKNFKRYSGTSDSLDFQIRLYEGSNKIEVVYGRCLLVNYTNGSDNIFEVGLRGASLNDFNNRSVTDNDTWSGSQAGKTSTANCRITNTIKPTTGLTYSWEHIVYTQDISIDKIMTTSGCGAGNTESITVLIKNNGSQAVSSIPVRYKVNSQSVVSETIGQSLSPGNTLQYTFTQTADFSTYGFFEITSWSSLTLDSFRNNDTFFGYHIYSAPVIADFPYKVTFEQNDGNWHSDMITGGNQWEWGTPAQTNINSAYSGTKAWMTDLNNDYANTTHSYLQSPCFNFSGFASPKLSFYMYMETETKWDPMVVEASTDAGKNWTRVDSSNTSFYNSTNTGGPFAPPYFSGSNAGWTKYTATLSTFGNNESVTLRYRFLSDGSTVDEGIAIDDVEIYADNDVSVIGLWIPQDSLCGDSMQNVMLIVKNTGKNTLYNIPFRIEVSGPSTQTINKTQNVLTAGTLDTITIGTFNSIPGGTFQFLCYSRLGSDNRKGNDTIMASKYFRPGVPGGGGIVRSAQFSGTAKNGSSMNPDIVCLDQYGYYDFQLPTGYSIIGYGTVWSVTEFRFETENGYAPSDTMISISPAGFSFGYIPRNVDADSVYEIFIHLVNAAGCEATYSHYVRSGEIVTAEFNVSPVCFGNQNAFLSQATVSSNNLTYNWDLGDGKSSTLKNPVVQYSMADTFQVLLTVTAQSGCFDTITHPAIVHEMPVPDFQSVDPCQYNSVTFANLTPSLNVNTTWGWNFGNGSFSKNLNGKTLYDTGMFMVTLTATSQLGCKDSISKSIQVYPLPDISFSVTDFCLGDSLQITNLTSISSMETLSYVWTLGASDTTSVKDPLFKPLTAGNYTIKLMATSAHGCFDSLSKNLEVHALPVAAIGIPNPDICLGDSIKMVNNSYIAGPDTLKCTWIFNNMDSSTLNQPWYQASQTGIISVYLAVTSDFGCMNQTADSFVVHSLPIADFDLSETGICLGDSVYTTNKSTSSDTLQYNWTLGTQGSSTLENPTITPGTSGSMNILLHATTNWGCVDKLSQNLDVHPIPDAGFSFNLGAEGSVAFTPNDQGLKEYYWLFGDGFNSADKNAVHQYKRDSVYLVELAVISQFLCENAGSKTVNVTGAGFEENNLLTDIRAYPNPFSDYIEIELNLQTSSELSFQLYDISGQLVYSGETANYKSGVVKERITVDQLAKGFYVLKINGSDKQAVYKGVTKVR